MITVTLHHDENRNVSEFEFSGHAGYDDSGKDLVCAAASTLASGTVNAIYSLANVEPKIVQAQEEGGYLKVSLPTDLDEETYKKVQLIIQVMTAQVYTLMNSYGSVGEFIKLEYKLVGGGTQ